MWRAQSCVPRSKSCERLCPGTRQAKEGLSYSNYSGITGNRTWLGCFVSWKMVWFAVTNWVSVSLCPPVFRFLDHSGKLADANSTRRREPAGMVMPVCHRSSVYSYTSPGFRNSGFFIDFRYRARILPCTKENTLLSSSTSSRFMNQSVSFADDEAYRTADTGPAMVSGLSRTGVV